MRRRAFISLLGGAAVAWPLAAHAQQPSRVRRIGVLMPFNAADAEGQRLVAALRKGLQELDWTEGRNLAIDFRWSDGDVERASAHAKELVALSPELIFAFTAGQLAAVARETRTIPIVFVGVSDAVGSGFVASLARPGGNITGFILFEASLGGKWIEALKEVTPRLARAAIMMNPETATGRGIFYVQAFETAATTFSVESMTATVHSVSDIKAAIGALEQPDRGLVVVPDTFTEAHRELIVTLAARHRVPTVYPFRHFAMNGGLMSYGPDTVDTFRRSAAYFDRILRGEKPGELPVQVPTKFELVINLKTAQALGLEIPPMLLARADEVIE
jgi:putative ABC transport system substrate-binding protein